ncbi:MAG TPA: hypothetical protein PLU11_08150 [Chitinophagaceae bacterium]|nr:hypothetical protein [Chitinophagaceae bacterium]HPH30353.1 hypothetical protein [Chitinophagaceae bacterium]HPN59129.1 hypothetical protein [Chitinophagaceae bacterium]
MKRRIVVFVMMVFVAAACSKELSYEGPDSPAEGSMQSALTGDCLPKTVSGTYQVAVPLVADSNTISVAVNVTTTGTYLVTTDTVNGFFFNSSGRFTSPGTNTVKLRSTGTPFAAGVNNFRISFDSTFCDVQVTVQ